VFRCSRLIMAAESPKQVVIEDGVIPVMLTPFDSEGAIDYPGLEALTQWYLDGGVTGLFPVAQSSEMYELSPEERLETVKTVQKVTAGKVPVCAAGTFAERSEAGVIDMDKMAADVNAMAEVADVVVVLVCQMALKEEDDAIWKANVEALLERTTAPMGLYECPAPYHRLLTPELVGWLAGTGRFVFHKDTSRRNDLISAKLAALKAVEGSTMKWFNGNCTTLLHSLREGSNGFSGVSANYYAFVLVWMVKNWQNADAAEQVQDFLTVGEGIVKQHYPASAKAFVKWQLLLPISSHFCRSGAKWPDHIPEEHLKHAALKNSLDRICSQMGITVCTGSAEAESTEDRMMRLQGAAPTIKYA